jgi:Na+-translocating ferredoxin:NAD+ oxidoreductase RnfG subunit
MSMPNQPAPPSRGGNKVLMIVLIVLAVLAVGCCGLCGGCYVMTRTVVKKADKSISAIMEEAAKTAQLAPAYLDAMRAVETNQAVIDRLGEPITQADTMKPFEREAEGELKPAGETIQFDVKGPKGTGIVSLVAVAETGGNFHPAKITVTFEDGSVVDVPTPSTEKQ